MKNLIILSEQFTSSTNVYQVSSTALLYYCMVAVTVHDHDLNSDRGFTITQRTGSGVYKG